MFQPSDDNANPRISSSRGRSSDEPHIGKYRLIKTIGKGNFAKVKLAKHVPTGREVNVGVTLHQNFSFSFDCNAMIFIYYEAIYFMWQNRDPSLRVVASQLV